MYWRPRRSYSASSLAKRSSSPLTMSVSPYSLSESPSLRACSRSRMLCCRLPVEYASSAPKLAASTTRRSTCTPSLSTTAAFVSPCTSTVETLGCSTSVSSTCRGSPAAHTRSMSPIVSSKRRRLPAARSAVMLGSVPAAPRSVARPPASHGRSGRGRPSCAPRVSPAGRCRPSSGPSWEAPRPAPPRWPSPVGDGRDAELVADQLGRLRPDAGHPHHVQDAVGKLGAQPLEVRHAACGHELGSLGGDGLAHARYLGQVGPVPDRLLYVRWMVAEGARGRW